ARRAGRRRDRRRGPYRPLLGRRALLGLAGHERRPPPHRGATLMTHHQLLIAANTIWVVVAAVLVMFMQAGFAFLEAGLTRMKNASHIAGKNVLIFGICSIVYWAVGFGLAFGDGGWFSGNAGFFPSINEMISVGQKPYDWFSEVPGAAGYLFEVVFAGVSLAIVCGAMAE